MALFAIRDYRRLFSAQIIALFGTGLATVALGLLAYELAGPDAGLVLGTALTIKMVAYVVIAPIVGAYADRLPRRLFLTLLDVVRAVVVLALPFVSEVWHIYVLIALLQTASAAFTPTFQAVIPDIVTDEADYTRALSASQVAYTMESLLSPVLAALVLSLITFNWLFLGTAVGFVVSAILVLSTRIPNASPSGHRGIWDRVGSGIRRFAAAPQLRGIMALNFVVAGGGAIVVVNTVNYVRDNLGGSEADVAWMLAASGLGTLTVALIVPRALGRITERTVMFTGALLMLAGAALAIVLIATSATSWPLTAVSWALSGAGTGLIITPTGRVIRASMSKSDLPAGFAAQFSLSHLAWLAAYPIAGWVGAGAGLTVAWSILGGLAAAGALVAVIVWPRGAMTAAAARDTQDAQAPAQTQAPSRREEDLASGEGILIACQCSIARAV